MHTQNRLFLVGIVLSASSLQAAISITGITSSAPSPQPLGAPVTFTATATDTGVGPLTFQYSVSGGSVAASVVRDYYPGTLVSGVWTSESFSWGEIRGEGTYTISVIAKDFSTGETATKSATYTLTPLLKTGAKFAVTATANPLVAIGSGPGCPTGDSFRLTIQQMGRTLVSRTSPKPCNPNITMNLYAAGMHPSTTYNLNYEVVAGTKVTKGPQPMPFTTGAVPSTIVLPHFTINVPAGPQDDQADQTVLHGFLAFGANTTFAPVATDLYGNVLWYYAASDLTHASLLTRPLPGGNMITIQGGSAWSPNTIQPAQLIREIDLAGNTVRETSVGAVRHALQEKGYNVDISACGDIAIPAAIGAACMSAFDHDVIRLPNGFTAAEVTIEKILPPGTQGQPNNTGNIDVVGVGIVILDTNLQAVWFFDTFQHASGAPQLDINRPAVLGETCTNGQGGCPPMFLNGTTNVAPKATDWLHVNSLYFEPSTGDIVFSSRHQDWVMKVDYANGKGTGNILWRMGLGGDFTFNNVNNDPYPWFSHQHDVGIEGNGVFTLFDNGNTRVAPAPIGLGSGNSRGMALTVDQTAKTVTPVFSQDLGYYAFALGSAQLLGDGNYLFQPGIVGAMQQSYVLELLPTAGTVNGTIIFNEQSNTSYRSWIMPNLYAPPTT